MSAISQIVNVQITAQTQSVSQAGFGQLLLVGLFKNWNDLIRMYSNLTEVAADFSPGQPEYIAAQDFFAQPVVPPELWIGRRTIDNATISVETAMLGFQYTTTINGTNYTATSTENSVVTFSAPIVTGNFIKSSINGVVQGIINSQINFDIDFVSSNSIVATVNGTPLAPVVYSTDQATTIGLLATAIAGAAGVTSATVTATKQITVVFTAAGQNTVNSVITTLGASQPVASIYEGSIQYATSSAATLTALAALWGMNAAVSSSVSSGLVITVIGTPGVSATVSNVIISGGASQATVTYSYPVVVVEALVALIGTSGSPIDPTVYATDNHNGTFSLTSQVAGTPWTLSVSTNIINPINCNVQVTQVIPGLTYQVTVNGTQYSYPPADSPAITQNTTADTISLGLVAVISADPNAVVTATDNGNGTFELASKATPQAAFSIYTTQNVMQVNIGLIIAPYNTSTPIATDLTALYTYDSNWYALALTDRTQATVLAAAAWAQGQTVLFGTASSDPNIINQAPGVDLTSIAYQLALAKYTRTWLLYNQEAGNNQLPGPGLDYPECAWFATMLWQQPGSATWALKQLLSIPYSELTTTQSNNARGKFANTYEYIGGFGCTRDGKVSGNEYIDIVIGIDWLTSTVQAYVFSVLVINPKVPYTNAGITGIQAQIERALEQGVTNNFIADNPPYTVTVPNAINVSPTDKANRVLNNVVFKATLAGAIQMVNIVGTVSV